MRRGVVLLFALIVCGLTLGTGSPVTTARAAKEPPHAAWENAMAKLRTPSKGCFKAAYPKVAWIATRCIRLRHIPFGPARGPRPFTIGNGNDFSGAITPGFGTNEVAAEGSFDSATSGVSETGNWKDLSVNPTNPPTKGPDPDAYSLQLNTQFFSTPLCSGHPGCQGWEQFLLSSRTMGSATTGTPAVAFIQFFLIGYGSSCSGLPSTWFSDGVGDCVMNSPGGTVPRPAINATNLASLRLVGDTRPGNDTVKVIGSSTAQASTTGSPLSLAAAWTDLEFAVVGDCCGFQAVFGTPSTIVVRTTVHYNTTHAPLCKIEGFTGETNNLNFETTPVQVNGPAPAVVTTESTSPPSANACQPATGNGDTHLTTFNGLLYDFQASGDFIPATTGPQFVVQTRQQSGAPTWPSAAVNKAVATRMGKTRVAICLPDRVEVNGKPTAVKDGKPLRLPGGVDVLRLGNVYLIRSPKGDIVRAEVNPTWINLTVGLGRWPTTVEGLLANANGNLNQLATRSGTVLTEPLSFSQLYSFYGNSWRVKKGESILCSKPAVVPANPTAPFYAQNLRKTNPDLAQRARAVCLKFGVKQGPLLDACIIDVAVIGNPAAAKVYVGVPNPAAVGIPKGK